MVVLSTLTHLILRQTKFKMKKPSPVKKAIVDVTQPKAATKPARPASVASNLTASTTKNEIASQPKASKSTSAKVISIEKACTVALAKLKELNIDESLQSEIQWCLGSYQSDKNPVGLYQMAKRAIAVFTVEQANKTKGVTAKLVTDLEKAIGGN